LLASGVPAPGREPRDGRRASRAEADPVIQGGEPASRLPAARMPDSTAQSQKRLRLEQRVREAVIALREECDDANVTLQIAETGDFVAILRIDGQEAEELGELLGRMR
jgi:hypothetical protein